MSTEGVDRFRTLFAQQLQRPEEDLELDRAALYLAGEEYPELDVEAQLARLDGFATDVLGRVPSTGSARDLAATLGRFLFDELGFEGNTSDYYNPDNSFLNRVLETRSGIPITLSLLFLETGRRMGLACRGVGLPGHFLVGLEGHDEYLNPFNHGEILNSDGCRELVAGLYGDRMTWSEEFLVPCTKYDFLFRMLNNLKGIFLDRQDFEKALGVVQRMQLISPGLPSVYKDLAWCHHQRQEYRLAINDLETYLQVAQEPDDAERVRAQIGSIWSTLSRLN